MTVVVQSVRLKCPASDDETGGDAALAEEKEKLKCTSNDGRPLTPTYLPHLRLLRVWVELSASPTNN